MNQLPMTERLKNCLKTCDEKMTYKQDMNVCKNKCIEHETKLKRMKEQQIKLIYIEKKT